MSTAVCSHRSDLRRIPENTQVSQLIAVLLGEGRVLAHRGWEGETSNMYKLLSEYSGDR